MEPLCNRTSATRLRARVGLMKEAFARLVGVDLRTVYRWEVLDTAPSGPAAAVLAALEAALEADDTGVRVAAFLRAGADVGLAHWITEALAHVGRFETRSLSAILLERLRECPNSTIADLSALAYGEVTPIARRRTGALLSQLGKRGRLRHTARGRWTVVDAAEPRGVPGRRRGGP